MKILKFNIIQLENSFHDKVVIQSVFNEMIYNFTALFYIRSEKDISDFFKDEELIDENNNELVFLKMPIEFRVFIYNTVKNHIDEENKFVDYHYTGAIKEGAYRDYKINYTIDGYPKLLKSFTDKKGEEIEFRKTGDKLQYVKKDNDGEIMRDSERNAVYMSMDEMINEGLNTEDTSIVAFNSKGESVGLASDEFGADGIWVNNDYQKRGIGLELLAEFRKQFKSTRKMGQMTASGVLLTRAYFRKSIK